jgi:hypothetical protein
MLTTPVLHILISVTFAYESFAKLITKTGLLLVILYYLNLLTPLKTPHNGSFTLLRVFFVLRFVLHSAVAT